VRYGWQGGGPPVVTEILIDLTSSERSLVVEDCLEFLQTTAGKYCHSMRFLAAQDVHVVGLYGWVRHYVCRGGSPNRQITYMHAAVKFRGCKFRECILIYFWTRKAGPKRLLWVVVVISSL